MINKHQIFGKDRYIVAVIFLGLAFVFWGVGTYTFLKPEVQFDTASYKNTIVNQCKIFAERNAYKGKKLPNSMLELTTSEFENYELAFIKVREIALACHNMEPMTFCLGDRVTCGMSEEPGIGIRMVLRFAS
jgi:hypothetical protein